MGAAERDSLFRSRNGKSRRQRDRARAHVDYEEMTVSYGRIKLGVPSGFRELLEDLTRGVIRDRPNNIPLYLQRHFQELVEFQRNEREEIARKAQEAAELEEARIAAEQKTLL